MKTKHRPRRDFEALERRRKRAAAFFEKGLQQAEVMRELKVSRQSVSRWFKQWKKGGKSGLKGAGRAGRKPRIGKLELRKVEKVLRKGARAHGFTGDLWTLPRVARVIEQQTGVRYHPGHVWRILRSLNWSLQRPSCRARERNRSAIRQWVRQRWPALKKTPVVGRRGSSSRMRVGSRRDPPFAALGRPEGRLRS